MEEKGGRSGRGGQREERGNKHPFAREQSSQIQLMASPGRGGGGFLRREEKERRTIKISDGSVLSHSWKRNTQPRHLTANFSTFLFFWPSSTLGEKRPSCRLDGGRGEEEEEEEEVDGATAQGASV